MLLWIQFHHWWNKYEAAGSSIRINIFPWWWFRWESQSVGVWTTDWCFLLQTAKCTTNGQLCDNASDSFFVPRHLFPAAHEYMYVRIISHLWIFSAERLKHFLNRDFLMVIFETKINFLISPKIFPHPGPWTPIPYLHVTAHIKITEKVFPVIQPARWER